MIYRRSWLAINCALSITLAFGAKPVRAQDAPIFSIGQPSRWQNYADLLIQRTADAPRAALFIAGSEQSILSPVVGAFSVDGELYGSAGDRRLEAGGRAIARAPALALGIGVDWNITRSRADLLLTYKSAILRGGLLGGGTMLRVDYLPTRAQTLAVGIDVPLHQPLAGRTRPRHVDVALPARQPWHQTPPLSIEAEAALVRLEQHVGVVRACANIWSAETVRTVKSIGNCAAADSQYVSAVTHAFALSAMADSVRISARARSQLLDDVLLPYDTLLGQVKHPHDRIDGLTSAAQAHFARWLADSSHLSPDAQEATLAVFSRWLKSVEHAHADFLSQWKGDSRYVWLPLQLALTPDQYDEQSEIDALIGRAVGHPFTGDNGLTYLQGRDIPLEIARSIHAARDYHVLWTHDITSKRHTTHNLDNIGYELVADAYYPALTAAVRRYDATGRLPAYLIFLDQYFYEPRGGRLWMTILEDPLHASTRLPGENADRERHLAERQSELRAAVAASARLQSDAAPNGGDAWLRRVVKVHVNITDPSDFSFRSNRIVPPWPMGPDNLMRDHRKIAFYDLTEADPWRGGLLLMGTGVGEQFASATWEDRGVRVRGPAALEARAALRRVMRANGYDDSEIPEPLREIIPVRVAERRANLDADVGRALQVQNEVGWGSKKSSIARAILYDLVRPGSVIIAPDPQWLNPLWGAMLAGAAARGARVYAVAPSLANAPVTETAVMSLTRDVMTHLLQLRQGLSDPIHATGGDLRVGIFTAIAPATDTAGRRRDISEGVEHSSWLRELFPFDANTLALLQASDARAAASGSNATELAHDEIERAPKLHQKTQLIAQPGAIAALLHLAGWGAALATAINLQARETAEITAQLGDQFPAIDTVSTRRADAVLADFARAMSAEDRARTGLHFTVGTQNQDPRGMSLDGEATLIISGPQAAPGVVDLYNVMARTTWVESAAEVEQLIPANDGLFARIARLIWPTM